MLSAGRQILRKYFPFCRRVPIERKLVGETRIPFSVSAIYLGQNKPYRYLNGVDSSCIKAFEHDAPLLETWYDDTPIESVEKSENGLMLLVKWVDGETQAYPTAWLRDNCHCDLCYHTLVLTRNIFISELPLQRAFHSASVMDKGQVLSVMWSDGHVGDFPANWLRGHRFDQSKPDPIEDVEPILWDANVTKTPNFRLFDFDDVMENDDSLYEWLDQLLRLGFVLIKNAPQKQGQQHILQQRLGYETPSPSSSGVTNQAKLHLKTHHPLYTEAELQLHTDLSYYTEPKGFQLFHCIQQVSGDGGDSLLTDAFKVAYDVKERYPEAFKLLSTVTWEYKLALGKNYHIGRHKIISVNEEGKIDKIVINDITRTSMLRIPVKDVNKAYMALKEFNEILYDPANMFRYKLEPGDILAFHNHRVLHGRRRFSLDAKTRRHLETCYSDWEIVAARMRQLRKQKLLKDSPKP